MGRGLYVGGVATSLNDFCVHENMIGSVTLGHRITDSDLDRYDNVKLDVCGNVAFGIDNRIDLSSISSGVVGFDNSLNTALYSFVSGRGNNIKVAPTGETFQSNYIFGINNTISGDYNFINGLSNEIAGDFNMAIGVNNTVRADAMGCFLLGTGLDTSANNCVAVGHFNENVPGSTFLVGTGANDTSRVNSLTVMMSGRVGLNTDERWQVALSRIGENDTIKIEDLLKKGESLIKGARIKLATIHGVKGNEKQNVVLPLCLPKASLDAYEKDPTDEHRLMYVGATRAKESLHIIYPKRGGYQI